MAYYRNFDNIKWFSLPKYLLSKNGYQDNEIYFCVECQRVTPTMFGEAVSNPRTGQQEKEYRCSYHKQRTDFRREPKFKCPENKCNKVLNFAECYFSTCCHEAMKNCRTSSEKVTLEHIAEKIQYQERLNKEVEEVIKKYQDDLDRGLENLRNLTATQERYRNFHYGPEVNEAEKPVCKICFVEFNTEDRFESAIVLCGHKFCMRCLSDITPKKCPMCSQEYTLNDILRLYS